MKTPKPSGIHRPFEALKDLLENRQIPLKNDPPAPAAPEEPPVPREKRVNEERLFAEAMAGVDRIAWNSAAGDSGKPRPAAALRPADECEEIESLRRLVDCGLGFRVSDTPEYMEGVGHAAPPGIARRLHRGDFAVQDHLDLHGLTAEEARQAFEAFIRAAILSGKRAVLIIHGRGLSSPAEPVLKTRVAQWLTAGRWGKWVVAFTSARLCDGGSGATYVLLRRQPLKKRQRRRKMPTG